MLLRGRHDDCAVAARPATETGRYRLPGLDHVVEGVETLAHEHVRVLADGVGEQFVGLGFGLRGLLALFGDAGRSDFCLVGIDLLLCPVVVLDQADHDRIHSQAVAEQLLELGSCLGSEFLKGGRTAAIVVVLDLGQRVERSEHGVEGRDTLTLYKRRRHGIERSVVGEESAGGIRLDAPLNGVLDAGLSFGAEANGGALVAIELLGLDGGVELGDVLPRCLDVQAVRQNLPGRATERCHDADVLGADRDDGADEHQDHGDGTTDRGNAACERPRTAQVAVVPVALAELTGHAGG